MQSAVAEAVKPKKNWTLDDVPWAQFDPALVDPEILKVIKAAALVEYNAHDYAAYLCNVFSNDEEFQSVAKEWALEEVQHGEALGRWAEMADPTFNFKESFKKFVEGFRVNLDVKESIRGSHSGELIARCIVETGTSSFYTAMADAVKEPALKYICKAIAGDELRHYKLFYNYLKKYLAIEELSPLQRLKVGLSRIGETEDDELAYAYFSANHALPQYNEAANDNQGAVYNRRRCTEEYSARAYNCYRSSHMERVVNMVLKACGISTQGMVARLANRLAWLSLSSRVRKAKKFVSRIAA